MSHNKNNKEYDYGRIIGGFHTDDCTCQPSPDWKEKLREEWKTIWDRGDDTSVANWWLSRMDEALAAKDAEIESLKAQELGKSSDCVEHTATALAAERERIMREVTDDMNCSENHVYCKQDSISLDALHAIVYPDNDKAV